MAADSNPGVGINRSLGPMLVGLVLGVVVGESVAYLDPWPGDSTILS